MLFGAHMSTSGGAYRAFERAAEVGCDTMQIFVKNNNRWHSKDLTETEIEKFRKNRGNYKIEPVVAHTGYLINLCATENEKLEKSRRSFVDEITRCNALGISELVFHPGSHLGEGEDKGLDLVVKSLDIIHQETEEMPVNTVVELTAGQGTNLGYKFEHIHYIISAVKNKKRMRVCLDTSHIFAAGYDIREKKEYEKTMKSFDEIIGLDKLAAIHCNDSKAPLGSRKDRHEHIGYGEIGESGFRNLVNDTRLKNIPIILETPKGKEMKEDVMNIRKLKSLLK
jgi:deoxyribonuclease-4